MQKNSKKKAFTIVELVIVIAVVAILAAVLIPTFAGIIEKANQSNDVMLCKNINTALASSFAADKPESASEALGALYDNGYILDNLSPTSEGAIIVYDLGNNNVALLDSRYEVIYKNGELSNNLWFLIDKQDDVALLEAQTKFESFSYVVTSNAELNISRDFDSALVPDANVTLTGESAKTYNATANNTSPDGLIAFAGKDSTYNFFGYAEKSEAEVDEYSLNVYGEIKALELTYGHLVAKPGGKICEVTIPSASENISFTKEIEGTKEGTIGNVLTEDIAMTMTFEVKKDGAEEFKSTDTAANLKEEAAKHDTYFLTQITVPDTDTVIDGFGTETKPFEVDSYDKLAAVLATDADTVNIKITASITFAEEIYVYNNVVLDLNGYEVSSTTLKTWNVGKADKSASLTVNDSSEDQSGKIKSNGWVVNIYGKAPVFTINSGTIEGAGATALVIGLPSYIEDGTLVAVNPIVNINGGKMLTNADDTNDSTILADGYWHQNTVINITGGVIEINSGDTSFRSAVKVRSDDAEHPGTINMSGGVITAGAGARVYGINSTGATKINLFGNAKIASGNDGYCNAIFADDYSGVGATITIKDNVELYGSGGRSYGITSNGVTEVTISGNAKIVADAGTESFAYAVSIEDGSLTVKDNVTLSAFAKFGAKAISDDNSTIKLEGGTYTNQPTENWLAEGKEIINNGDGTYSVR